MSMQVVYDFIMGGSAGVIAKTICAPLERVKLLLQTQHNNPKLIQRPYTGIGNCFVRVIKEEGFISLWRGNMVNVYRYFPTQALNFAFKDSIRRRFCPYKAETEPIKFFIGNLMAGGMAGCLSLIFVYPLDFARTRLGVDLGKAKHERQFTGLIDCCRKIYKTDGLVGLYRGFAISVFGIFFYRSLYFGGYDAGKQFVFGENQNSSFLKRFLFAQFVTNFSEIVSYPTDTLRRRLMMESGKSQAERQYKNAIDCTVKIWRQEGMTGFFKGNLSNCWRSVGSSLVLVLYDELQKFTKNSMKKTSH